MSCSAFVIFSRREFVVDPPVHASAIFFALVTFWIGHDLWFEFLFVSKDRFRTATEVSSNPLSS